MSDNKPSIPERPVHTVREMLNALRLGAAKQRHLFYKSKRQAFYWEQSLFSTTPQGKEERMQAAKPVPTLYRQGDVLFRRIHSIPREGAVKRENGVIAYGEVTGHTHSVSDLTAAEVLDCGGGLYVHVGENGISIQHQEHGPIELPAGDYQVTIQREYSPEEIRSVVD